MDEPILVFMDLESRPTLVGRLWARVRNGRESASFEYDERWLGHPERFALEPALKLGSGPYHTAGDRALFGAMGDSSPDRWGRVLMRRAERNLARLEGRTPRTLLERDFLLRVHDEARQGALRFALHPNGPFLDSRDDARIPLQVDLPRLVAAADRVVSDSDNNEDLGLLLAPGSSLGGARPKASVREPDGALLIAKFPRVGDDHDVVAWEGVALALASEAGIVVPEWWVQPVTRSGSAGSVLMTRRFDRRAPGRTPYLSAMSMVSATDHDTRSYLEIAEAIRRYGSAPNRDLTRLWRRLVFNILVSNTDDHLRNHGFIYDRGAGWRLSPAFDLNPVPTDVAPRFLATTIDLDDATASIELALETAEFYGLSPSRAREVVAEVGRVVSRWKDVAAARGIPAREIDRMASAFEHEDLKMAVRLRCD